MTWTHETEPLTKRLRVNPTDEDPSTPLPHEMLSRMIRERLEAAAEIERLRAALDEIISRAHKAWMPMQAYRSEEEEALDSVRHEVWEGAADIARAALKGE